MSAAERRRQQAVENENVASAALVSAERRLVELLQLHRTGSPAVDAAVTEVNVRRHAYIGSNILADEADQHVAQDLWQQRQDRREDHRQRLLAALNSAQAVGQQPEAAARAHSRSSSESSLSERSPKRQRSLDPVEPPRATTEATIELSEHSGGISGDIGASASRWAESAGNELPGTMNQLDPRAGYWRYAAVPVGVAQGVAVDENRGESDELSRDTERADASSLVHDSSEEEKSEDAREDDIEVGGGNGVDQGEDEGGKSRDSDGDSDSEKDEDKVRGESREVDGGTGSENSELKTPSPSEYSPSSDSESNSNEEEAQ